jgi:protoporphyrinogen oxidase
MDVGVIGGGPAGLGAAYSLARAGVGVTVYEAGSDVGGLARSFELWGQPVDLGPHLLQRSDPRIDLLWESLIGDGYTAAPRRTRILMNGRFLRYPYEPWDVLRSLGLTASARCLSGFARQRLRRETAGPDLESWAVDRFGRHAFDLLFRPYVQKLFGIGADQIDRRFAATLVTGGQGIGVARLLRRVAPGGRTRRGEDRPIVRPVGGVGRLTERLADAVTADGGIIRTGSPVERLRAASGSMVEVELQGGEVRRHDHVISTLPVAQLVAKLADVPAEVRQSVARLRVRAAILLYARLSTGPVFTDQWIFLLSTQTRVCRVTDFANFHPAPAQGTKGILCAEYWCARDDPLFLSDETTVATHAEEDLRRVGILPRGSNFADAQLVRLPSAIPVLSLGYPDALEAAIAHLKRLGNISTIGRFGGFGNESVHSSILQGMDLADALLARRSGSRDAYV